MIISGVKFSGINYWLKARLLEAIPPGEYAAFWLGGRATVILIVEIKHDELSIDDYHDGDRELSSSKSKILNCQLIMSMSGSAQRAPAWGVEMGSHEHNH